MELSSTTLEPGQVLPDLPARDLLVVAEPLVPLHAGVVVDVVLAAGVAERLAQDGVGLELADRLEEVRRQRAQAAPRELLVRLRIEVLRVRLAGVETLLDPVEAGCEHGRRG